MPYVAFLDMLGTRAAAEINSDKYRDAINSFNSALKEFGDVYKVLIYGYSDNAYVEFSCTTNLIQFFRDLRSCLLAGHHYFSAAVHIGQLDAEKISLNNGSLSMKFTSPATIEIYRMQSQSTGIGIFLSEAIVTDWEINNFDNYFCTSICLQKEVVDNEFKQLAVYDLLYDDVTITSIKFMIDDYLLTAATDVKAGRYYITPIISMIKSLDQNIFTKNSNLLQIVQLLSFQTIPKCFQSLPHNHLYSIYFLFALIERTLFISPDSTIDKIKTCELIIKNFRIDYTELVTKLPSISPAIISKENRQEFLSILFNLDLSS